MDGCKDMPGSIPQCFLKAGSFAINASIGWEKVDAAAQIGI
jgi:hypothetical protein